MWLGDNLRPAINYLLKKYSDTHLGQKFMVLHWTPSEIINPIVPYEMITLPRCEDMKSSINTTCKYELTPILKYYSSSVKYSNAIYYATVEAYFEDTDINTIFQLYENKTDAAKVMTSQEIVAMKYRMLRYETMKDVYDDIACSWMKDSQHVYMNWNRDDNTEEIYIGGIFPMSGEKATYSGKFVKINNVQSNQIKCNLLI